MTREDSSSATDKLTFLLIGAGIGATLALLFAPKKGSELRGDIADYTKRGIDVANEGARRLGERAGEYYEEGRSRAIDAYGTAREKVGEAYGTAREKVTDIYGTAREKVAQKADVVTEVAGRQKDQIAAAIEAGKQAYLEEKKKMGEPARAAVEGDEA